MNLETDPSLPYVKTGVALLAFISLAIVIYALSVAGNLLIPFVVAVFLYILLQPVVAALGRLRLPRQLVTALAMTVTVVVILGISRIVYQGVTTFTEGFPRYEQRFGGIWSRLGETLGLGPAAFSDGWAFTSDPRFAHFLQGVSVPDVVQSLLVSANSLLSNLVLVFIFLLFLLIGRDSLPKKMRLAFPPAASDALTAMTKGIEANMKKYVIIKTLVSLLAAGCVMVICLAFGLDFVIAWGILTFFLNFIPNIGSIVASILPLLFALVQFDDPMTAVWIGLAILVVKFSIGNFLEPALMGKSIDLSPLLIMFSLIFWGSIWGVAGMFLSVPLTAIVKIVFDNVKPLRPVGILMGEATDAATTEP